MKRFLTIFIGILTLYAYSSISAANAEKSLSFQGQLFETNTPKTGSVNATFTFYDAVTGGNITGSPIVKTVTVSNGYFGTQFSESDTTGVDFNQQLYLEVTINGTTLSPRTSINPTVSSLKTFGTFSYTSAPTVGPAGSLYFNTTDNALYTSDGTSWTTASSSWLTNGTTTYYTAGNVGVGTANPSGKFEVGTYSAGVTVGDFLVDSANKAVYVGRQSSTSGDNTSFYVRNRVGTNYFGVNIASSTGFFAGNFGIGTTTPTQLLHVVKPTGGSLISVENTSTTSLTTNIEYKNTLGSIYTGISANQSYYIATTTGLLSGAIAAFTQGGNVGIGTTTPVAKLGVTGTSGSVDDLFVIASSSNVRLFTITSNGNVGIGSSTPSAKLTVAGDIRIDDTISRGLKLMRSGIAIGDITTANSRLTFQDRAGAGIDFISSSSVTQMMLTGTGNLGIGTSSPTAKLSITGTAGSLNDLLYIASSTNVGQFVVKSNGYIGIGTSSPSYKLDVFDSLSSATARFLSDYTSFEGKKYGSVIIGYGDATSQGAQFGYVYDPASALDSFAHITPFGTSEGDVFAITRRSKVGVGTTTPEAKFSISANNSDTNPILFSIASSTSATSSSNLFTVTNAGVVMVNKSKTANPVMSGNSNQLGIQQFGFPGQQNTITMYANGGANNVIAGYSTPGTADVPTATLADTFLLRLAGGGHTGSTYTSKAEISMMTSENWSSTSTGAHIAFYTTATSSTSRTEKMRLVGNGFLGLGTTTPTAQLTTTGTVRFASLTGAGANLIVDSLGNVTVSSDERLKDIQGDFITSLDKIKGITPITYKWKPETGYDASSTYAGFSAQNIQANIPEAVSTDSRGFLTLADRPILAALVNAVKEIGAWFVDGKFKVQNDVCVDDFCMTKDEFKAMMMNAKNGGNVPTHINIVTQSATPPADVSTSTVVEPVPAPETDPVGESSPEPVLEQ